MNWPLYIIKIVGIILFLTSCAPYAGLSVHSVKHDKPVFKEAALIATVGVETEKYKLYDYEVFFYYQHKSLAVYTDEGYGLNEIGFTIK